MKQISVAFWNLQNLFGTNLNEIASDLKFTPELGWNEDVLDKKLENLAKVIRLLGEKTQNASSTTARADIGNGPDLLGVCEVENINLANRLIDKIGRSDYKVAEYKDSPDLRGIDTCLIYSTDVFECIDTKSYNINLRYPTRDIFEADLVLKINQSDLKVLVNHWPSRKGKSELCDPNDTEFSRCMVAESCGKIVDEILKIPKGELYTYPNEIFRFTDGKNNNNSSLYLDKLEQRANSNILLMGDFNDEPFDKSIVRYLNATPDVKLLKNWKELFEINKKVDSKFSKNYKQFYLEYKPYLFNCMWDKIGHEGTLYFWVNNSLELLDQFIISKGLLFGNQKLKLNSDSIRIYKSGLTMAENLPNKFDAFDIEKLHPVESVSPMEFCYQKYFQDSKKERKDDKKSIPLCREPNTGYSDHFPIQCSIDIV